MKRAKHIGGEQAFRAALALYGRRELEAARKLLLDAVNASDFQPEILQLLGGVCGDLGRGGEALTHLRQAVKVAPNSASAHFNLGRLHLMSRRYDDAVRSLQRSVRLNPRNPEAIAMLGTALQFCDRHHLAIEAFTETLRLDPAHGAALAGLIEAKLRLADWTDYDLCTGRLLRDIERGKATASPFNLLLIADDPELHLANARREVHDRRPNSVVRFPAPSSQHRKLRLAYICADFRRHPTARLMASFFGLHDREQFEVIGVSLGADDGSDIRRRLVAGFDHMIDAEDMSSAAIAEKLRSLDVDIAIDLMGHIKNKRLAIYQHRAAPIQVAYLAFPGTTGADYFDYIILDSFIATERVRRNLSEKPVILPGCYQVNDHERPLPDTAPSRADCGLPEDAFIFCAFNNIFKITPAVFDVWMRILNGVDRSVLWLLSDNETVAANLRKEASARGVSPDRLIFGGFLRQEDHLPRYRLADLCLDTLPYGGHTTTSDALWMGSPVLTCAGESIAARVAGSLLHAVGLGELVTGSLPAYEALAIDLARKPDRLEAMRTMLAADRRTTPLFDTARFTRNIEGAYSEMWRLYRSGEGAREIDLSAPA